MLTRTLAGRSLSIKRAISLAMEQSSGVATVAAAAAKRRRHYRARKPAALQESRQNVSTTAPQLNASVATTPLAIPLEDALASNSVAAATSDAPKFADLLSSGAHPTLIDTIEKDMNFATMTPVQAATLPHLLKSRQDVVAEARTGTGKTLAFLLPSIQSMITRKEPRSGFTSLLVISPTRELALQIAGEAKTLLQRFPQYKVGVSIGGTNVNRERAAIESGCDILIATPRRLLDHFGHENRVETEVRRRMQKLDTLVLDEADRLLDMGFTEDLKSILSYLPQEDRQTMLFSATFPKNFNKMAHFAVSDNHDRISTIPKNEAQTHDRVPQYLITVPGFSDLSSALLGALRKEQELVEPDKFKAIVFAPTAGHVVFYHAVLAEQGHGLPPFSSYHSRLSQPARTRTTNQFKQATKGILIATDVAARGMDFPAVTSVFQVGVPDDKDNYVHRLGRTARAGAEGRGILILTSHESYFTDKTFKGINFQEIPADLSSREELKSVTQRVDSKIQHNMYRAWLGFYKSLQKPLKWSPERLVTEANQLAKDGLGCQEIPGIKKSTISKMGLKGVRGLVAVPDVY